MEAFAVGSLMMKRREHANALKSFDMEQSCLIAIL